MSNFREANGLWNDLTDEQSEKLVGGAGVCPGQGICTPPDTPGFQGWFGNGGPPGDPSDNGLLGAGHAPSFFEAGGSGKFVNKPLT